MNDNKNLILAVVLSALILLGWTWLSGKFFPTPNPPPAAKTENGKPQPLPQAQGQSVPGVPKVNQSREAALAASPRVGDPHAFAEGVAQPQGRAAR